MDQDLGKSRARGVGLTRKVNAVAGLIDAEKNLPHDANSLHSASLGFIPRFLDFACENSGLWLLASVGFMLLQGSCIWASSAPRL
jgi:hypothetical protein